MPELLKQSAAASHPIFREGWTWLVVVATAKGYLALVSALATIAVLPVLFGFNSSVVQSSSMEPGVSAGDVVLASALQGDVPVPVGAVATFERDGQLILHRIVEATEPSSFVTAGDANPHADSELITRADITGVARILVPAVGLPSLWLLHGELDPFVGWLVATAIALAIVLIGFPSRAPREASSRESDSSDPDLRRPRRTAGLTTVGTVLLSVALAASTVVAPQVAAHAAAFSARTDNVNSTWSAKVFTPLTIGRASGYGALAAVGVQSLTRFDSVITGSVGTSPGRSISGFWPHAISGGSDHDTPGARAAMTDVAAIPAAAAERGLTRTLAPTLSGTLGAGTYESTSGAFTVAGTLVLDGKGDPGARFIFRTSGSLTLAHKSRITLTGGARAANVWWVVGSTMTGGVGTASVGDTPAVGNFIVTGAVALNGVDLSGRVVSRTGSIVLRNTHIVVPAS